MSTDSSAAVGMARIAPASPISEPPIEQRDHHRHRADADAALHDFRHQHVRLELVQHEEIAPTISASFGDTVIATATAVTPPITGPTIGIVSPIAATSAIT